MLMKRASQLAVVPNDGDDYGARLRGWRQARGFSQLKLATEAGISTRHLSFLENGRSQPSRSMVELLSGMLDLPLEGRNGLLLAAGYAPAPAPRPLTTRGREPVAEGLRLLLAQQEPNPAMVVDHNGDIVERNRSASRIFGHFVPQPPDNRPANAIRSLLHPRGLRPFVVNWEEIATCMLTSMLHGCQGRHPMLDEVMAYPGVRSLLPADLPEQPLALLPMHLKRGDLQLSFVSTVVTPAWAGTSDTGSFTIKCLFPADGRTDAMVRRLAGDAVALPLT